MIVQKQSIHNGEHTKRRELKLSFATLLARIEMCRDWGSAGSWVQGSNAQGVDHGGVFAAAEPGCNLIRSCRLHMMDGKAPCCGSTMPSRRADQKRNLIEPE